MNPILEIFVTVVEENSFTKAAKKLHMTQPAVSQAIRKIEQQFKHPLLEREHKKFHLNQAGKIVYQYAKEILLKYQEMEEAVNELEQKPSGDLRIGVSYTIGEYFLPMILPELIKRYPDIQPHVIIHNTDEVKVDLLNEKIDIALVEGIISHQGLQVNAFAEDNLCIIASHTHLPIFTKPINTKMLENFNWIIREKGSGTRDLTEDFLMKNHLSPKNILTLGSIQIIKEAVEAGLGISILSELSIQKEVKLQKIQKIPVNQPPIRRSFYCVKRRAAFEPKRIKVFEQIVYETADRIQK